MKSRQCPKKLVQRQRDKSMTEKVDDQSVRPKILTGILKGENRKGKGAIYQKKKKKKTRKLPRIESHEFQD